MRIYAPEYLQFAVEERALIHAYDTINIFDSSIRIHSNMKMVFDAISINVFSTFISACTYFCFNATDRLFIDGVVYKGEVEVSHGWTIESHTDSPMYRFKFGVCTSLESNGGILILQNSIFSDVIIGQFDNEPRDYFLLGNFVNVTNVTVRNSSTQNRIPFIVSYRYIFLKDSNFDHITVAGNGNEPWIYSVYNIYITNCSFLYIPLIGESLTNFIETRFTFLDSVMLQHMLGWIEIFSSGEMTTAIDVTIMHIVGRTIFQSPIMDLTEVRFYHSGAQIVTGSYVVIRGADMMHLQINDSPLAIVYSSLEVYNTNFEHIYLGTGFFWGGFGLNVTWTFKNNTLRNFFGPFFMLTAANLFVDGFDIDHAASSTFIESSTRNAFDGIDDDKIISIKNTIIYAFDGTLFSVDSGNFFVENFDATIVYSMGSNHMSDHFAGDAIKFFKNVNFTYVPDPEMEDRRDASISILSLENVGAYKNFRIECVDFGTICHQKLADVGEAFRCEQCGSGFYTHEIAVVSILNSKEYIYTSPECIPCPNGALCSGSSVVEVQDGYFLAIVPYELSTSDCLAGQNTASENLGEYTAYRCPLGYCKPGEEICADGRTGFLCGKCKEGMSQGWGVPECFPEDECSPILQMLANLAYAFFVAYITVSSTQSIFSESTNIFKICVVTLQVVGTTSLPHPPDWERAFSNVIDIIGIDVFPSPSGATCLASGISTQSGIMINLLSVAFTTIWTALIITFGRIRDKLRIVQIATLLVFFCISPFFDIVSKMLICKDYTISLDIGVSFRAFYFAEVECYQNYQYALLYIAIFIIFLLIFVTLVHFFRNKYTEVAWMNSVIFNGICTEMEKPFEPKYHCGRLWGYFLIFYRIYMLFCSVFIRHYAAEPVTAPLCAVLGSMVFSYGTVYIRPFRGKISNITAQWGMFGIVILSMFQLGAEIQLKIQNGFQDNRWIQLYWSVTLYILFGGLAVAGFWAGVNTFYEKGTDLARMLSTSTLATQENPELDIRNEVVSGKSKDFDSRDDVRIPSSSSENIEMTHISILGGIMVAPQSQNL